MIPNIHEMTKTMDDRFDEYVEEQSHNGWAAWTVSFVQCTISIIVFRDVERGSNWGHGIPTLGIDYSMFVMVCLGGS